MKKVKTTLLILVLFGLEITQIKAQTTSASNNLVAQPIPDRTVSFSVSDAGVSKPITWGLDLAWLSEEHMRRGIAFMGADRVDIVRSSFMPALPLVNGDFQSSDLANLNSRLDMIKRYLGTSAQVDVNDTPPFDAYYDSHVLNWANVLDASTRHHQEAGLTVVSVSTFNEVDYTAVQTGITTLAADFYYVIGELKKLPRFNNIRIAGPNTLNCDQALPWYNQLKDRLDEGNTHQLAGSFDSYANFHQTLRANGDHATNDEVHNIVEGIVGAEYGLQTGIWWGTAELARGEFVKACDGVRLGYAEHRINWTAASVYRNLDGKVQAFGGTSERQAATTTYRFVSKDRDVYYEGYGPQREYTMVLPGGAVGSYGVGQTNAERVVNITWGDDIQPAINGKYVLVNRNSGKVMEVDGGSTNGGAYVQQNNYTGETYQQWNVTPVDSRIGGDFSYFTITAVHSGQASEVASWSLENGGSIKMWDVTSGSNQQWYLDYAGDGWFYIRSRFSAKCAEVVDASTANGADIQQWDKDGGTNQQWRFLPVGAPVEFISPSVPTNLVATANAESVLLNWTASTSTDVAGYTIFRAETSGGTYNTIARNVTSTSFVDNTTTTAGTYYYKIKAVDNSLNRSAYSNEASATPTGSNALVTNLQFDGSTQDNSINLNHGASYGTISYVTGKVGSNAISLNGSNAFVQLPATLANQQAITIATWVYLNGGSYWQRIFDFGNDQNQYLFLTPTSGYGTTRFAIKNGGAEQILETSALPTGTWSHVAVTLGTSGAIIYVNGVAVATSTAITIRPSDFKPVLNYIGRSQFSDPLLNGYIDDFRVYNYALSASEIVSLAGIVPGGTYSITNVASGKCLDNTGSTTNGTNVGQWTCVTSTNLQWVITYSSGYYKIMCVTGSKYLDSNNHTADGSTVCQWSSSTSYNQQWTITPVGSYYKIINRANGKCLDTGGGTANGSIMQFWSSGGSSNQLWALSRLKSSPGDTDIKTNMENLSSGINFFPNPVDDELFIKTDGARNLKVDIYTISGTMVYSGNVVGDNISVTLKGKSSGIYIVKVNDGQTVITKQIVKK